MLQRKKNRDLYADDYAKIKPGYAPKQKLETENNPETEGFTNVIKVEKQEARNKALMAQQLYKQELDAQIKAKQDLKPDDDVKNRPKYSGAALEERNTNDQYDYMDNFGRGRAQGNVGGGGAARGMSVGHALVNKKGVDDDEKVKLAEQKRKQQEMKEFLELQMEEKKLKKTIQKQEDHAFAKNLQVDSNTSAEVERQNKWSQKERQQDYAGALKQQILTNQHYKKTNLW